MNDGELDEERYYQRLHEEATEKGGYHGIQYSQSALNTAYLCTRLDKLILRVEELTETMRDLHRSLKNIAPVENKQNRP